MKLFLLLHLLHLLLPLFLILCFSITIHAADIGLPLITSTCKTCTQKDPNIEFDFCTASFRASPASKNVNLRGLGMLSINLILHNITDTRRVITNILSKNKKLDAYVRQCLNDCFELYSGGIDSVKQGMKYYKAERYDNANVQISSVMDSASTCEDGFTEKEGAVSPLTKRNSNTFQLSAMALSVMNMVNTG